MYTCTYTCMYTYKYTCKYTYICMYTYKYIALHFYKMAIIISVVSQKGGVGKSTISRLLASEYTKHEWNTLVIDLDTNQSTTKNWSNRRDANAILPEIQVQVITNGAEESIPFENYDLIIYDGAPHASGQTLKVAIISNMIIIPTSTSVDDLEPTVRLAHELCTKGVSKEKIYIALVKVGNSNAEILEAKEYLKIANYNLFETVIPEKTSYRRAHDIGKSIIETTHPNLNKVAENLISEIIHYLTKLQNG